MKEITIRIDKTGKVHLDFNGFQGDGCFFEREKILELLRRYGVQSRVEEEVRKPEAYEEVSEEVKSLW